MYYCRVNYRGVTQLREFSWCSFFVLGIRLFCDVCLDFGSYLVEYFLLLVGEVVVVSFFYAVSSAARVPGLIIYCVHLIFICVYREVVNYCVHLFFICVYRAVDVKELSETVVFVKGGNVTFMSRVVKFEVNIA